MYQHSKGSNSSTQSSQDFKQLFVKYGQNENQCKDQFQILKKVLKQNQNEYTFYDEFLNCLNAQKNQDIYSSFIYDTGICDKAKVINQKQIDDGELDKSDYQNVQDIWSDMIKCSQLQYSVEQCSDEYKICQNDNVCNNLFNEYERCIYVEPSQMNILASSHECSLSTNKNQNWINMLNCVYGQISSGIRRLECHEKFPKYQFDPQNRNPCSTFIDRLFSFQNKLAFSFTFIFIVILLTFV
ncbi:hypothetical protein PPERSA_00681 [Pseudocohnilembus persalinus]|uniref:Transmembrane protein n=1 Tax=Pseudocohnilembus persalinus TaxID=266149 RepID=A0A0V0QT47_PSEPJ|nr:hypothetical protein PPERSA_00681 [Pseudocohnilembus persalinus]|eukprot:KRX05380.1 hypothetical protein PPERSA_00681 [Pseudocohnilembus persalinus]